MGIMIKHYEDIVRIPDPYETTRMQWKVGPGSFMVHVFIWTQSPLDSSTLITNVFHKLKPETHHLVSSYQELTEATKNDDDSKTKTIY